ncbi:MAG: VapE domain-containing protein [Patescibacteria group bacterium]
MKKQALQYLLTYGFSVFPVGKDKRPLLSSWKEFQTRLPTEEEINKWWKQFPDANIGIATGKVSNITVVDIDSHKGTDSAKLDQFPKTYTVKTGNGGLQLYYNYQAGLTVSTEAYPHLPHVDIRSDGGYVVAPPSVTDYKDKVGKKAGGKYTVIDNSPFADFPIELFGTPKKKSRLSSKLSVPEGSRNSSMASIIGTILLPLDESKFMTDGWNAVIAINKTYAPPLPDHELEATFSSIVEKERRRREVRDKNVQDLDLLYTLTRSKDKIYTMNIENMCRILRSHPDFKGRFQYDRFRNVYEMKETPDSGWREFEGDTDVIKVLTKISIIFPFFQKVRKDMISDAIINIAMENEIDSATDYIRSLKWDGKNRLSTWLDNVYGSGLDKYHIAVGSNVMKGLVKRLISPGCKFDYVLVLEGPQGSGKSSSLSMLGSPSKDNWHVETTMSTDNKDFFMQFQGKGIIEFSEGETLSRTEVKKMKAIITMQNDRYRVPYGKVSRDFPRRCIFAMTTNQVEYLKDETGNRRWLPVAVTLAKCNLKWLEDNREQLYAEAYHRVVNLKETIYEFPEEETLAAQKERQIHDPHEEIIANWYWNDLSQASRKEGITIFQVFRDAINNKFATKSMTKYEEMSIAYVLKSVIKLESRREMKNNVRTIRWYNPNKEVELTEDELAEEVLSKW